MKKSDARTAAFLWPTLERRFKKPYARTATIKADTTTDRMAVNLMDLLICKSITKFQLPGPINLVITIKSYKEFFYGKANGTLDEMFHFICFCIGGNDYRSSLNFQVGWSCNSCKWLTSKQPFRCAQSKKAARYTGYNQVWWNFGLELGQDKPTRTQRLFWLKIDIYLNNFEESMLITYH